jgi:hypothetical protein
MKLSALPSYLNFALVSIMWIYVAISAKLEAEE